MSVASSKNSRLTILLIIFVSVLIFYVVYTKTSLLEKSDAGSIHSVGEVGVVNTDYDVVVLKTGDKFVGKVTDYTHDYIVLKPVVVGNIDPVYHFEYSNIDDVTIAKPDRLGAFYQSIPDSYFDVKAFKDNVILHYTNNNFDALENLFAVAYDNKKRFSSGEWQFKIFYDALNERSLSFTLGEFDETFDTLEQWRTQYPESIVPVVLLVRTYIRRAWKYRGGSFNNGVSKKDWSGFSDNLIAARKLINSVDIASIDDPEFHSARVTVSLGLNKLKEELSAILTQAVKYDSTYYPVYTEVAPYLLPRWRLGVDDVEMFSQRLSEHTGSDEVYARIADAIKNYTHKSEYKAFGFEWSRIQKGFEVMAEQYPGNFYQRHAYTWMACYYQDYKTVKRLTDVNGLSWNEQSKKVWGSFSEYYSCKKTSTLEHAPVNLHREIRAGNLPAFAQLLQTSNDLDVKNAEGETLLLHAIRNRYIEFSRLLIDTGADVTIADNNGVEPIHEASEKGMVTLVKLLLAKGADVNSQSNKWAWSPLHYAASYRQLLTVRALLQHKGINVNTQDNLKKTPLHLVAKKGFNNVAVALLDQSGIDVNALDRHKNTPLNMAVEHSYSKLIRLLKKSGAVLSDSGVSQKAMDVATRIFNQALKEQNSGHYNKAEALYRKALEANPYSTGVYANIALLDIFRHDFESCLINTKKAIEIDPFYDHAIYSAGQCLFMLNKPKEEYLAYYRRYLDINPDNFRAKELLQKYPELRKAE